jgi:ornithine cyclodeaminase/alanine dehydrogenase-like protein (mu-crystallin family)
MSDMKTVVDDILSANGASSDHLTSLKTLNIQSDIKKLRTLKQIVEDQADHLSARATTLTSSHLANAVSDIASAISALETELSTY